MNAKRIEPARSPWSLRSRLLITVNGALLLAFAVLLVLDYQHGLDRRLADKQNSLQEEATILATAVAQLHDGGRTADVQRLIDNACSRMQDETSPGHHIAVRLGDQLLQARTHQRASPPLAHAMQLAASTERGRAQLGERSLITGSASRSGFDVYVSEYVDNVVASARQQVFARAIGVAAVGLALTLIINLALERQVSRPVSELASVVRRIGGGHPGVEPRPFPSSEFNDLAVAVGSMSRSLAEADRIRQSQMDKAKRIQQNLLPSSDQLGPIGIHHVHLPADDVGGDFFDVKLIDETRTILTVGDVTGHGIPAAMTAGMLKALIDHDQADALPHKVLGALNRRFHAISLEGDFATMVVAVIDREQSRLHYASAGHEIGYVVRGDGQLIELGATGMLLGVDPEELCEGHHVDIQPGDRLVLLTDGLVESMSPEGALLGRQTIRNLLHDIPAEASAPEIAERLLQTERDHRRDGAQQDDITLVVVSV